MISLFNLLLQIVLQKILLQVNKNSFLIPDGHELNTPELLFEKIEDYEIMEQLQKLKN